MQGSNLRMRFRVARIRVARVRVAGFKFEDDCSSTPILGSRPLPIMVRVRDSRPLP